ncbi:hypothetical protein N9Q72_01275 [Gammaproteobacteria bacterium]|nr:hypothetical protein [Gammaproteobacteria bacterium]
MNRIPIEFIIKIFLVLYVVFNMTTLRYSLGLTSISTIFNASIYILVACAIGHGLAFSKLSSIQIVSLILIFFLSLASFINVFLNFSFVSFLQAIDFLLPWLAIAMVLANKDIMLINYKSYLQWFNSFLVIVCLIGLLEYIAIFSLGYRPPIMELNAGMGEYYVGYSTLLQKIYNLDVPYFRFQGPFLESGDLAMWGSIFVVYNLLRFKYVYAAILLFAIFGSFSPSAFISLALAFLIYIQTRSAIVMPIMMAIACISIVIYMNDILDLYNNIMDMKVGSLDDRLVTNLDFIDKFYFLINAYPFGVPFFESTNDKIASGVGFTANYGPIGSYMTGGVIAFLIYIIFSLYFLFLSVFKILLNPNFIENELYVYYIMLFSYVIQRGSFFEYAISALLFAPIFFDKFRIRSI